MLKRFAGVLSFVLLVACVVLLLPRLVYANTGTPPTLSITDGSPSVTTNPVPVGSVSGPFTTVTFQVSVNNGNERNESGPVTPQSQQYTINGGGGLIVGVGAPQGYTTNPTSIPSTGVGSVTVTGSGTNSFPLSVTLFFPVSAAGNDTVTCTGTLTLSDGTQVGSSPSGSVQVAAVAVDSIALADDPSTVQIGQTLTRSDFTITTTPSGYDQTKNEDGSYFVAFSPESFPVKVGDNIVTASVGPISQATYDLTAQDITGSWTSADPQPTDLPDLADFTITSSGFPGSYSVKGSAVAGGDTSGPLTAGVAFDGTVKVNPPPATDPSASTEADMSGEGQAVVVAGIGPAIPFLMQNQPPVVAPALPNNGRILQTDAPAITKWAPTQSTAGCSIDPKGAGVYAVGLNGHNLFYLYTKNPQVTVTVNAPVPAATTWGGVLADTVTNEAITTAPNDANLNTSDEHGGLNHGPPAQATAAGSDFAKTFVQSAAGSAMLRGPQVMAPDSWTEDDQNWSVKW